MRDAEDRVAASKTLPPPELMDPKEPLPEVLPSKTGFKASFNSSVNKLMQKKPVPAAEVQDPDAIRVRLSDLFEHLRLEV